VLFFDNPEYARPFAAMLRGSLRRIGIRVDVRMPPPTPALGEWVTDPSAQIGFMTAMGWQADYPNASTWFVPLFYGPSITERGNYNRSLLGATHGQLESWGYGVTEVPSADERIERCQQLIGKAQIQCWADLDLWLMEEVVPAIPLAELASTWVTSPRVVAYSFDAATNNPALDRIALVAGSE
jgi:ABC-type transport system substrate-binding protein